MLSRQREMCKTLIFSWDFYYCMMYWEAKNFTVKVALSLLCINKQLKLSKNEFSGRHFHTHFFLPLKLQSIGISYLRYWSLILALNRLCPNT